VRTRFSLHGCSLTCKDWQAANPRRGARKPLISGLRETRDRRAASRSMPQRHSHNIYPGSRNSVPLDLAPCAFIEVDQAVAALGLTLVVRFRPGNVAEGVLLRHGSLLGRRQFLPHAGHHVTGERRRADPLDDRVRLHPVPRAGAAGQRQQHQGTAQGHPRQHRSSPRSDG
jgi:hypothetical protein